MNGNETDTDSVSSVTLKQKVSKGVAIDVKIYDTDPYEASRKAKEIFNSLIKEYPAEK